MIPFLSQFLVKITMKLLQLVLWSLRHAAAGLHLLQSFRKVAVVGLELLDLVQCRSQLLD